jgi:acyl-coenzyme A synthetase/AMP-(fatty) acid ligase
MTAALQWTTFLNMVLVVPPPSNISADQIIQVLQQSKAEGAVLVPSQIADVLHEPSGLAALRELECIYFAGAPLPKPVAEKLVGHVKIQPAMGTTESGAYWLEVRNEDDWEYYRFRDSNGIEMQPGTDDLHELVFKRQPQLARWQQIFHLFPDLEEFHTKDLWTRHPVRPDLWRFGGRTDDLVNLTHGESLYVTPIEATIQEHPDIRTAIVGGQGRIRPFVIIELGSKTPLSGVERDKKLSAIWPYVQKANARCVDEVKISQGRVLFADIVKPLPRTAKETVMRNSAFALYQSEIDLLYTD